MAKNWSKLIKILNIIQFVITIIVSGLISDEGCTLGTSGHWYQLQFIIAVIYGYLIVNIIILAVMLTKCELDSKVRLMISGGGAILWFSAGSIIVHDSVNRICSVHPFHDRSMAAGVISLLNAVAYGVETTFHSMSVVNKRCTLYTSSDE